MTGRLIDVVSSGTAFDELPIKQNRPSALLSPFALGDAIAILRVRVRVVMKRRSWSNRSRFVALHRPNGLPSKRLDSSERTSVSSTTAFAVQQA